MRMGLADPNTLWSMEIEHSSPTIEEISAGKKCDGTLICQIINFLIDNIYIKAWSPYSRNNRRICLRRCSKEDFKAVNTSD